MPETGVLGYRTDADGPTMGLPALDETGRARVAALLAGPTVSAHEHPVRFPEPLTAVTWAEHMAVGTDVLADRELVRSGLDVVVAHCFSQPKLGFVERWATAMTASARAADGITVPDDGDPLIGDGVALLLGLEDLGPVRTLADVERLRGLGIVSAGVAYNSGSPLGCGLAQHDTGLTAFGRQAIATMNRIGMIVDVSHAGARTSLEAADASDRPVVANHAGAAALWPSARMIGDDVIRAVAATGGFIGIEAAPGSTRTRRADPDHTVEDVVRHVEHCAELVGVDAVALGGDTFYGDHVGLYRALGSVPMAPDDAAPFDGAPVAGADHPGELVAQVATALVGAGWSDDDVAAVIGGTSLRVLTDGRLGA